MTAIVRDALVVALLLAAIASGLFFHGDNDIIYAAALGFLLVAAGFAVLTRRTYALPQGAVVWLLLALWGWLTLSLCWSTVPFASLLTWLVFAAFPLATLSFGQTRWVVPATFVGLALLATVDLCQLAWRPATYGPRAHWPLLDANNLAALFNLGLAPALAAALRRERWTAPTLATGVLLAGIVATQSRAGMLAALVVMMMLVWLLRGPAIVRRVSGVISATVLFTLPLLLAGLLSGVAHRIAVAPASDANLAARLAIWRGAARLVAAHPWRGTGFGTFYLYYPAVRPPLLDNSTGNWAHNDLLQYAAEAGVPAALLLAALILAIGWRVAAALRTAAPLLRNEIAGCVAGLFALALQAQVEFQFYVLPTLIVAGLWLARLLQLTGAPTQPLGVWHRPYAVPLAAAGVLLPLAALTASSADGIYYFRRAAADIADARVGAFLDDTARAEKIAPSIYAEPKVQLAGFYLDLGGKPSALFKDGERAQMLATARDLLAEAQAADPAWAEIDRKQAKLAALQTPPDPAAEHRLLASAVAKDPMNVQARRDLALLFMQDGRARDALSLLQTGLAYPHDDAVTRDDEALIAKIAPYAALQSNHATGETAP